MGVYQIAVAFGTAVQDYDLLTGKGYIKKSANPRVISGMCLTGGGAVGDCGCKIDVSSRKCGELYNSALLVDNQKLIPCNIIVLPNEEISAPVFDVAPSGNMVLTLSIVGE